MNSLNRRIRALEDNLLQPIEPGSSKLHLFQPVVSEAEEVFFRRVYNIAEAYRDTDELPSPKERKLLEAGVKRLFKRAIDLFESVMQLWFGIEDSQDGKFLWTIRFWYFMMEFGRHMKQVKAEAAISAKNKSWKKYEKAWKEYEATLSPEDKIPLWSDESFSHFMDTYIFLSPEEIKDRRKQRKKKEKVPF
jgi:hypothetical protein